MGRIFLPLAVESLWAGSLPVDVIFFPGAPKNPTAHSDLETGGFTRVHGGKGSHRKFTHPKFPGFVLISGHDGDDAPHYLEKQIRTALRRIKE